MGLGATYVKAKDPIFKATTFHGDTWLTEVWWNMYVIDVFIAYEIETDEPGRELPGYGEYRIVDNTTRNNNNNNRLLNDFRF